MSSFDGSSLTRLRPTQCWRQMPNPSVNHHGTERLASNWRLSAPSSAGRRCVVPAVAPCRLQESVRFRCASPEVCGRASSAPCSVGQWRVVLAVALLLFGEVVRFRCASPEVRGRASSAPCSVVALNATPLRTNWTFANTAIVLRRRLRRRNCRSAHL